jgi:hypothetical protein
VVVGLTVVLTFPVTVVSGAGSQRSPNSLAAAVSIKGTGGLDRYPHKNEAARANSRRIDR